MSKQTAAILNLGKINLMSDKRLIYRVILKLLSLLGIIALLLVFLNATFYSNIETQEAVIDAEDTVVDVSGLSSGTNTVVRWNNQRIGILKRSDADFFVYFDVGDSGHCPLFFQNEASEVSFKDTCSGSWFDADGRFKSDGTQGLKSPPHHFTEDGQLLIGR